MGLLNRASFLANLIIAKITGNHKPLTVIFNLTDRCNSSCSYCYAAYYKRKKEEMPLDKIINIINELSRMGCKRISFGGGEPLMRDDIANVIECVKKSGMDCVINSNGYLVESKIDILKNVDVLCLSLDGDEKSHDMYRGSGSFKKVMNAIECASKNKITVNTNTVLHKDNLDSIEFVLGVAKRYKLLAEFNLVIDFLQTESKTSDYKSKNSEIKDALRRLISYKKEGHNILFSEKALEYALSWPDYGSESYSGTAPGFKHASCFAGKYFCLVDTNGDVYPCPHLIGKTKPLNAAIVGFREAFTGLDKHDCRACYQVYHNEFNLLFNLDYRVICNQVKNSLKVLVFK